MEKKLLSAGKGAVLLTLLALISDLLGFVYRVALSRLAGAQVMGLYQLVMPMYSVLLSMTAIGLTAGVNNLTARNLALHREAEAARTLRTALWGFLLLMLPAGAALIFCSDFVSTALLGDARTQLALILLVPCTALTGVENLHKHFFYGAGRVAAPAVVGLAEQLIRTAAVVLLLLIFLPQWPERALGLVLWGMILCEVFSACTLTVLWRRDYSFPADPGDRAGRRRKLWAIALPVGVNALLGNLLSAANAALIPRQLAAGGLSREAAMEQFGVLCGMTLPMLSLPTVFLGALTLILGPRLARAWELGQRERVRSLTGRSMYITSVLALPSLSLMAVVGPELGLLLFGRPVDRCLLPMAAVTALGCWTSVLACGLNGMVRHRRVAAVSLLGGAVQLGLTCILVPLPGVGLEGCAAASLIAGLLEFVLLLGSALRLGSVEASWYRWFLVPGLSSALAALWARLLFRVLQDSGLAPLPLCLWTVLPGVFLYLLSLRVLGGR